MPYTADPYDDTKPTGATLALYLDEEMRAAKGALIDHKARVVALEASVATDALKGLVRLATSAEFAAGNTAQPALPSQVLAHVNSEVAAQSSFSIGTLQFRIGTVALGAGEDTVVVFDDPFPVSFLGVWFNRKALSAGAEGVALLYRAESVNGFTITHNAPGTPYTVCWIAAGVGT